MDANKGQERCDAKDDKLSIIVTPNELCGHKKIVLSIARINQAQYIHQIEGSNSSIHARENETLASTQVRNASAQLQQNHQIGRTPLHL